MSREHVPFEIPSRPTNYDLGMILGQVYERSSATNTLLEATIAKMDVRFDAIETRLSVIEPPVLAMVERAKEDKADKKAAHETIKERMLYLGFVPAISLATELANWLFSHFQHALHH